MYSPGVGSSPKGRNDFHRAVSAKRYWNRFVVVFSCLNNLLLDSLPLPLGSPQGIEVDLSPQHFVNTSQHHPGYNHPGYLRATSIQHTLICGPITWNPSRPKGRLDQVVTQMLICSSSANASLTLGPIGLLNTWSQTSKRDQFFRTVKPFNRPDPGQDPRRAQCR